MRHAETFFAQASAIASRIDYGKVEQLASELAALRDRGGRLFVLGVGGSAGNASHSVKDFRKLCGIEAYAPVDNVSELTARPNEGWDAIFTGYLNLSRTGADDAIFVFSAGSGDAASRGGCALVEQVVMRPLLHPLGRVHPAKPGIVDPRLERCCRHTSRRDRCS